MSYVNNRPPDPRARVEYLVRAEVESADEHLRDVADPHEVNLLRPVSPHRQRLSAPASPRERGNDLLNRAEFLPFSVRVERPDIADWDTLIPMPR